MQTARSKTPQANPEKDPAEWVTGDEPMTGPQESYLGTLAREAGEAVDHGLTKAEASEKIEELQEKTGRGRKVKIFSNQMRARSGGLCARSSIPRYKSASRFSESRTKAFSRASRASW